MESIAARAGVAVGTLYNHFVDREALVNALFDAFRERMGERIDKAAAVHAREPFRVQLEGFVREVIAAAVPTLHVRMMLVQSNRVHQRRRTELREWLAGRIETVLQEGRRAGEVCDDPDRVQPMLLLGMLHSTVALAQDGPQRLSPDRLSAIVTDVFLNGVSPGGRRK